MSVRATPEAATSLSRVFLLGCPRSGTTLLQALLAAHPDIASFPESHIFLGGHRLRARVAPGLVTRRKLKRFARAVGAYPPHMRRRLGLHSEGYRLDLIDLLDRLTVEQGRRVWIEKTPNHVLEIPEIRALVPSSRFVHLIRDGRAVVASLYEVTRAHPKLWGGVYEIARCVDEWNKAILASSEAIGSGEDGIVVDYGALTEDPGPELRRLCEFLALEYEPEMLAAYATTTRTIVGSKEKWKQRVSDPIRDNGMEKYNAIFSAQEQKFIEEALVAVPANIRPAQA